MKRPLPADYPAFYRGYVSQVPEGDLSTILRDQTRHALDFWRTLEPSRADFAYAPGKWTLKEVLGHIIDAERVFSYRLFSFARGEQQALPGMDQDDYMAEAAFALRDLGRLIDEYQAVRNASQHLIDSLTPADWTRTGTASGGRFSLLAMACILVGHERHHLSILRERYDVDFDL